jgi:hypothetical protein
VRLNIASTRVLLASVLILTVLASGAAAQKVRNMLMNGDFEIDTGGWTIGGGQASLTIDKQEKAVGGIGNAVYAQVDAVGPNAWEPEIHSPAFDLENGEIYTFSFWAKCEPEEIRTLYASFEQLVTYVGMGQNITVTEEWQEFHYTGIWNNPTSPPQVVIHIGFELQLVDVWFSHFRVYNDQYEEEDIEIEGGQKIAVTPRGNMTTAWGKIKSR